MSIDHETQLIEAAAKLHYEALAVLTPQRAPWHNVSYATRKSLIEAMRQATLPLRTELETGEMAIRSNGVLMTKNSRLRARLKAARATIKKLSDEAHGG